MATYADVIDAWEKSKRVHDILPGDRLAFIDARLEEVRTAGACGADTNYVLV